MEIARSFQMEKKVVRPFDKKSGKVFKITLFPHPSRIFITFDVEMQLRSKDNRSENSLSDFELELILTFEYRGGMFCFPEASLGRVIFSSTKLMTNN